MAEHTHIEWTDATWNPITGCTLVSDGCKHCYAATLAATRLKHHPSRSGLARLNAAGEAKFTGEVRFNEQWLDQPLRWKKPRRIFVCAHGDLFHENVPDEWIDRVFAVMALAPQHTFQVLTKRSDRMRRYFQAKDALPRVAHVGLTPEIDNPLFQDGTDWPLPNVWLGVSVEDQSAADERIPDLLATPAAVRFVSAEPLLGPVDLTRINSDDWWLEGGDSIISNALRGWRDSTSARGSSREETSLIDWVIVGGESGKKARPMHPDWARSLRDQCAAAGVAFFFKQWGEYADHTETHGNCNGCTADSDLVINPNGNIIGGGAKGYGGFVDEDWRGQGGAWMCKTGKSAAGRLLDGREWNEVPG